MAVASALSAAALVLAAAARAPVAAGASGCVPALHDVRHAIEGSAFASHYVFAGPYAYGEFRVGGFGGQSLWRKTGAGYCRVPTGARSLDALGLAASGVPRATAAALRRAMAATAELAPPARARSDRQARR